MNSSIYEGKLKLLLKFGPLLISSQQEFLLIKKEFQNNPHSRKGLSLLFLLHSIDFNIWIGINSFWRVTPSVSILVDDKPYKENAIYYSTY